MVAGATPAFLRVNQPLLDQLFRTDVEFGSGNEQHPLIVMGPGVAERLRNADLLGIDLLPAQGEGLS